jgi:deazaflavin-dependent oxidoreductase (nitroreductase family)
LLKKQQLKEKNEFQIDKSAASWIAAPHPADAHSAVSRPSGLAPGRRFLMLTHIGRKSGNLRQAVLEVVHHDTKTDVYFIAAGWRGKADWFKNIQANPVVQIMAGTRTFQATAVVTQLAEASATFFTYASRYPLAFRELSRILMGETFQPNQEDCLRFAQSMPLVKLIPIRPAI